MAREYLVTGLTQIGTVVLHDGTAFPPAKGGTPMYGYCGMRPWTDSITLYTRVGEDFFEVFNPWFDDNGIDRSEIKIVSETTPCAYMRYDEQKNSLDGDRTFADRWGDRGFWRPQAEDLPPLLGEETKGLYICGGPFPAGIWGELLARRDRYGFKVMWEPNAPNTYPKDREGAIELCRRIEMASFNLKEGCRIFGIDTEQALIEFLKRLGPELVLLRVGARGLYAIADQKAYFLPSAPLPPGGEVVDTTGCGNASTAGACVAWCEGCDPVMTGIRANISSMYNLLQSGPYPLFDDALTGAARALAEKLYADSGAVAVF